MNEIIKKYTNIENCFSDINRIFNDFEYDTLYASDQTKRFIFLEPKDSTSNFTLLVAHLDTVQVPVLGIWNDMMQCYEGGAGYDCRSGFNACMKLYNELDNVAVLLTDNEETGKTTAQYAESTITNYCIESNTDLHLMIELDREKSDYVFYDFYNDELETILETMGVSDGWGSFSDICRLDGLGVCGINLGIGYSLAHSKYSNQSMTQFNNAINIVKILTQVAENYYFEDQEKSNLRNSFGNYHYNATAWDEDQFNQDDYWDRVMNGELDDEEDDITDEELAEVQLRSEYGIVDELVG